MKIIRPAFHRTYGTGRAVASIVSLIGWIVVVVGLVATLVGFSTMQQAGPFAMLGVFMGVLIAAVGLLQVAAGHGVRAALDTADYARQTLKLEIAQAEGLEEIDLERLRRP